MKNGSVEGKIQEEDCVLSVEEISCFEIVDEEETSASISVVVFIEKDNVISVVVEKKINSRRSIVQTSTTTIKSFSCEIYKNFKDLQNRKELSKRLYYLQIDSYFQFFILKVASSTKSNIINISKRVEVKICFI